MNRYYVVLINGSAERRVGHEGLTAFEAESKRDRLNESLAHQGVKYSECRYAVRVGQEFQREAVAA